MEAPDKIIAKISSWTAKKLSYAERVQLVQTVLFDIQAFWAQLYIIPTKILKLIEGYCRKLCVYGTKRLLPRHAGTSLISEGKLWIK
ncbi:hypothetical protein H5410_014209 [Solanum commersonii]|uniref:Reverse transcriptase n=1 Tax=Solanum commersonii TaxID=4109 RepID=A0A9J5ZQA7_SOLCO|nr:hypothetical protein H5410_014209 [Solanum commersonii]